MSTRTIARNIAYASKGNKYVPLNEAPTRHVLERHDGREETRDRWVVEGRRGALEHASLPWHRQV